MSVPFWVVLGFTLPFFLNDFLFITYQDNFNVVMAVDYGTRLFVLAFAFFCISTRIITKHDLGLVSLPPIPFVIWTFALTIYFVAVDRGVGGVLYPLMKQWSLFAYPSYPSPSAKMLDLTFGLVLVSVSEEIVFRGLLLNLWKERVQSRLALISILALPFGLIHWSVGPHSVISSAICAVLPLVACLRIRSIYPAVIAHFVTNFVVYSALR